MIPKDLLEQQLEEKEIEKKEQEQIKQKRNGKSEIEQRQEQNENENEIEMEDNKLETMDQWLKSYIKKMTEKNHKCDKAQDLWIVQSNSNT